MKLQHQHFQQPNEASGSKFSDSKGIRKGGNEETDPVR